MILADVNILVYAFDEESQSHPKYRDWLVEALSGPQPLALIDTVLTGFLRVVTDARIYQHPTTAADALTFVNALIDAPSAVWLAANKSAWESLELLVEKDTAIKGKLVPDAYLAAAAIANGARLATADRGFSRYPGLNWFDPAH